MFAPTTFPVPEMYYVPSSEQLTDFLMHEVLFRDFNQLLSSGRWVYRVRTYDTSVNSRLLCLLS